ncbi:MAG: hypothetical protein ACLRX2_01675 [Oscillospiraceae bacterium]
MNQTKLLFPLIFISLEDDSSIVIPPQPTSPGEIMSGGEGEPVEADEPEEGENDTTPAETEHTISGVLASTETVTHEYLTQSGKVVRETITTSMDTTTLDFFYDESGRPFAFNYTPEGSTPNTYYIIIFSICRVTWCRSLTKAVPCRQSTSTPRGRSDFCRG